MDNLINQKLNSCLSGEITIPPDKSISHRSLIFGALCNSKIEIKNLSLGEDCLNTLEIFKKLGVKIEFLSKRDLILDSSYGFSAPSEPLNCGNSGTTTRLLSGLFARCNFDVELFGDSSLSKRPMKRIIEPLQLMGAKIASGEFKMPLKIQGTKLRPITYHSKIASAQVKSCLILAGLGIEEGYTRVYEPILSRNHTEIMLEYLGADINCGQDEFGYFTEIKKSILKPKKLEIVGDISSAAFFMVAAAIVPNSSVLIKNVGINPTRAGILEVFSQAGINYQVLNKKLISNEPVADILVNYTENIQPFEIKAELVPRLIDEIPILAVLASQANGTTIIQGAQDLRNKESDRIKTIVEAFGQFNIQIKEKEDGFIVKGGQKIASEAKLETYLDHRLAMSYYVLSLINEKNTQINGISCINTSFPEFMDLMSSLIENNGQ